MMQTEELRFRAGNASLAATLTLPAGEGRHPWALLVPSWLPRDRSGGWDRRRHASWFAPAEGARMGLFERLSALLAAHGVASLRYDPRGCGESDGAWERTALFTRIDDARDAIGAMRSRPELDLRQVALIGHGDGAGIALSVAIGDPVIGVLGLIGPSARSLRTVIRAGASMRAQHGTDLEHAIVAALDRGAEELIERADRREPEMPVRVADDHVVLELAAWEQGFHTPPLALGTMLHRPIVIVHGADDAWSPVREGELLGEVLAEAGNDPLLTVVAGAGHDLAEADDGVLESFVGALVERMVPRELPPVLVAIEEMSDGR